MYLGSWKIDDYLTFIANTHSPSTGAATDADAVPSYRIYEDETTTAILTGSMAKLDDTNTLGFYSERVQLTAANGFEAGKSYTIYITATVGTVEGTISHSFQMQAEVALHADWINGGRLDLLLDAVKGSTDDWLNGNRLDLLLDAIKLVTDDWADGQRLDLILDAVKERTDNLPDDPADQSLVIAATAALAATLADMSGAGFDTLLHSLVAIRARGDAAWSTSGSGSTQWTYTLTNSAGGAPISDADVWVTTDLAGLNIVANSRTDAFGVATFFLDPGTYYIWRQKSGWNFDNPDTETVT